MKHCPQCGEGFVEVSDIRETLVGYGSPSGHDHNDNCMGVVLLCERGHEISFHPRRRCFRKDCDWVGKEKCFCHEGKKDPEWPNALEDYLDQVRRT